LAAHRLQLLPGEEVLVDIRPHWSFLSAPLAVSVIVIAIGVALDIGLPHTSVTSHWVEGVVVAVPCLWLAARVVRWRMTSLVVTSLRIIEQWGVMSRRESETMLSHIVSVTAVQTVLRRIIGTGRIELEIRGDDEIRWIDDVRKPMVLRRVVNRRLPPFPSGPDVVSG
jgi:uncharacterized membrane protein YdbT with pleckstrin-like domain